MPKVEFDVSAITIDRLFAVKKAEGYEDLTGNEFAAIVLERELKRLCPEPFNQEEN